MLCCRGAPGDVELAAGASAAVGGAGVGVSAGVGVGAGLEDIPGVPSEAWVRVQRGVPPADPYTPGDTGTWTNSRQHCQTSYIVYANAQRMHS